MKRLELKVRRGGPKRKRFATWVHADLDPDRRIGFLYRGRQWRVMAQWRPSRPT